MFNKQTLKAMINERLSETAEEIFVLFEQAVAEYQRETERLKHVGEAEPLEAVPSPQWTKEVQQEVAHVVLHKGHGGWYFPGEVKAEPSMTQEDEPQMLISNVQSLFNGDELQPSGRELTTNREWPEASGAAGTENCPGTSPEPEEDSDTANDEDASRSDASKETFSCPACKKCFPQIRGLKMHMRKVHPDEKQLYNAVCKIQLDSEQLTPTQPDVNVLCRPFSCSVCFRRFKLQSSLDVHVRAHAEENPRTCGTCGASFPNQSSFISHMRHVHSSDKPFVCSVCYRDCRNRSHLKIHMRIHTGERPFVCSVCGKGFTKSSNLKYHLGTHSRKKLFRCEKCGELYKSHKSLMQHECAAVVLSPILRPAPWSAKRNMLGLF